MAVWGDGELSQARGRTQCDRFEHHAACDGQHRFVVVLERDVVVEHTDRLQKPAHGHDGLRQFAPFDDHHRVPGAFVYRTQVIHPAGGAILSPINGTSMLCTLCAASPLHSGAAAIAAIAASYGGILHFLAEFGAAYACLLYDYFHLFVAPTKLKPVLVLLLALAVSSTVVPAFVNGQCVPGMAMTCMLKNLNMVTDGLAVLRSIPPNTYYTIQVEKLSVQSTPSGAFLTRVAEFTDVVGFDSYHDPTLQLPAGLTLSAIYLYAARPLREVVIGAGEMNLTELSIYRCALESIPATIGNLPLLEQLTISECALKSFSFDAFRGNLQLRTVDLSRNAIQTILPSNFIGTQVMLAIETLYLSYNLLQNLNMIAFDPLANLNMIDLQYNSLTKVSADRTVNWPALEMLDVGNNRLAALDLQWLSAPNLKRLILSNNLFQAIPPRLRRFPSLQLIGLGENNFTGIDLAPLNGLPMLNSLDFSANPGCRYVRSSRPIKLPMLTTLYVEYCALVRFNTSGINLPTISFISLAHNNFSTVPPLGQVFQSLDSFSMADNPLPCSVLKARTEMLLSGKMIMGPPQLSPNDCPYGSVMIKDPLLLCCKA
uniref:Leucine rich immune protein (Coil-less) n=1 Tax=Anopheles farauti TaxID=69004 RepID=A0A182QP56_9DIPT